MYVNQVLFLSNLCEKREGRVDAGRRGPVPGPGGLTGLAEAR